MVVTSILPEPFGIVGIEAMAFGKPARFPWIYKSSHCDGYENDEADYTYGT